LDFDVYVLFFAIIVESKNIMEDKPYNPTTLLKGLLDATSAIPINGLDSYPSSIKAVVEAMIANTRTDTSSYESSIQGVLDGVRQGVLDGLQRQSKIGTHPYPASLQIAMEAATAVSKLTSGIHSSSLQALIETSKNERNASISLAKAAMIESVKAISKIGIDISYPSSQYSLQKIIEGIVKASKIEQDTNLSSFKAAMIETNRVISKAGIDNQESSFRTIFDAATVQSKSIELSLIPLAQSLSDAIIQDNLRTKSGKLKPINQIAIATEAIGIIAGVRNNKPLQNAATQLGQKLKQKPVSIQFTQIVKKSKQDILNRKASFDVKNEFVIKVFKFLVDKKQVINNLTFFIAVILAYHTLFVEIPISKESLQVSKESLRQTEIQTSATLLTETSEREVRRNVKVKSKPGSGDTISELRLGDTVKLITFKGNYALVIFVDSERVVGQKGWVSRSALRHKKTSE
jgi:hypothetical protein